jgi:maleamate amidohydrolase
LMADDKDGDDALRANYARAFDGHLPFGSRPALVIVDFVRAYTDPASPLHAGPTVEPARTSAMRLVTAAREAGLPILFTAVRYRPGGPDGGLFYRKIPALALFDEGSPWGAFAAGLEPAPDDLVVVKQYASAFFGTSLASTLTAAGVDTVLVAGCSTSGCVRATALDALQHGFAPFVVRDACADRHPAPHHSNLFDLQAKYAEVVDESEALAFIDAARQGSANQRHC